MDELQYLEWEARQDLEAEMAGWAKCEEGHPIHPDALYCQTCRDLYIHWAYGLNAVQHAALGRALDPDTAVEKERVA